MKHRSTIIIIVLILAVLQLAYTKHSWKSKSHDQSEIIAEQNATIDSVKFKNGTMAFDKLAVEADLKTLTSSYSFLEDSLKAMGIKVKHLQNAIFLARQTNGSGSGRVDTVQIVQTLPGTIDTLIIGRQLNIKERFFSFNADLFPDDSFNYRYTFTDSLSIVNSTSRKHWFAPREYKIRVVSANPKTTLKGATSLTVKEHGTRWAIGVFGGYSWNGQRWSPSIGIGLTREIISF